MKNTTVPTPNGEDIISKNIEYFRVSKAAEILHCAADDILHLGATGNASIIAPVLSEGIFEWPVGSDGIAFDEIEEPFKRQFGLTDRVVLSMKDLSAIEAIGWTTPNYFSSPLVAQEVINYLQSWMSGPSEQPDEIISQIEEDEEVTETWTSSHSTPWRPDSKLAPLRQFGLHAPWHAVNPPEKQAKRTTINHLFISKKELSRLINGHPQDDMVLARKKEAAEKKPEKVNGHTERHASTRETVLKVAIHCKAVWPDECGKSARAWAAQIDEKSHLFWHQGAPPLSRESIERLLSEALKKPDTKY